MVVSPLSSCIHGVPPRARRRDSKSGRSLDIPVPMTAVAMSMLVEVEGGRTDEANRRREKETAAG